MKKELNMKIYFKHSDRCPISARAKRAMDSFLENNTEHSGIEFELIDVIANKARSDEIAGQLGIQHESPQIILSGDDNRVLWTAAHWKITEKAIKDALEENPG